MIESDEATQVSRESMCEAAQKENDDQEDVEQQSPRIDIPFFGDDFDDDEVSNAFALAEAEAAAKTQLVSLRVGVEKATLSAQKFRKISLGAYRTYLSTHELAVEATKAEKRAKDEFGACYKKLKVIRSEQLRGK